MGGDGISHDRTGERIAGRYELREQLGAGGMGVVYLARQDDLGRDVVIKLTKPTPDGDERERRFEKEARVLSQLAHPHIVAVHEFGRTEGGELYLVMERLRGHSLSEVLAERGRVPWPLAVALVRQIALALEAAHRQGVAHRDLKPANVFLVRDGGLSNFVKVLDFGLAKPLRRGPEDESLTADGDIVGTPAYMSPEQIDGEEGDERSDLYALGVVFYEMLTGANPFRGESSVKTMMKHLDEEVPPPSTVVPDIPAAVDDVALRLLSKQPALRPASSSALLRDLPTTAGTSTDEPTSSHTHASASDGVQRERRRRRLERAAAACFVAAAVGAVALLAGGEPFPPRAEAIEAPEVRTAPVLALQPWPNLDMKLVRVGERMYQDPRMSGSGTISCQSCHPLEQGGTTAESGTRMGASAAPLAWNTPSTLNAAHTFRQVWKAEVEELGDVLNRPVLKEKLMNGGSWDAVAQRLSVDPDYARRLTEAGYALDERGIKSALAEYMRWLTPVDAPFDRWLLKKQPLPAKAVRGFELFKTLGCASCHQGRNIGGNMTARFGVMLKNNEDAYADRGRCVGSNGEPASWCRADETCLALGEGDTCRRDLNEIRAGVDDGIRGTYFFKVPSLRNIELTKPYFHDGSVWQLDDAIRLMGRLQLNKELSDEQVDELAAFLESLTGKSP
jgi:serine/threonine-protein kinase